MLRSVLFLIKDILDENNLSSKDLYNVFEKCAASINGLRSIVYNNKDTEYIKEIEEGIREFVLLMELVHLFTRDDSKIK